MQPVVLVCLWLFWFQHKGLPYMWRPSRDALRWSHLGAVSSFTLILCSRCRHCALSSPFDQCHTVPDRLSHGLSIALVEEARLHLTEKREEHDFQDIFSSEPCEGREGAYKKGSARGRKKEQEKEGRENLF